MQESQVNCDIAMDYAATLILKKKWREAELFVREALLTGTDYAETLYTQLAAVLLHEDRLDEAVGVLEEAVTVFPQAVELRDMLDSVRDTVALKERKMGH